MGWIGATEQRETAQTRNLWWVFLITGVLWVVIAMALLRFNTTSIVTIGVLVGAMVLFAGINEFFTAGVTTSWRWLHLALGALFVVVGTVALFSPGRTFWAMASLIGLFLVIKGVADVTIALLSMDGNRLWWLGLTVGILEIGLGFWAHGGFGRSVVLLLVWAAAAALARGITEIVFAFQLRDSQDSDSTPPSGDAPVATPATSSSQEYGKAA